MLNCARRGALRRALTRTSASRPPTSTRRRFPPPESIRDTLRQSPTELPRDHDDLPTVMRFVGNEVRQDVANVQREVPPDVHFRRRHLAHVGESQHQERFDPPTATLERRSELARRDRSTLDHPRPHDAVLGAEGPDPAAPRIVQMGGDRANGSAFNSWNGRLPHAFRHAKDQTRRNSVVRPPGFHDASLQIGIQHSGIASGMAQGIASDDPWALEPRHVRYESWQRGCTGASFEIEIERADQNFERWSVRSRRWSWG